MRQRSISKIIGTTISNSLSTREKLSWQKALGLIKGQKIASLKPCWPVESVLFVYPGKKNYGHNEPIFWELKLFGKDADHGFFLEIILPAMEVYIRS